MFNYFSLNEKIMIISDSFLKTIRLQEYTYILYLIFAKNRILEIYNFLLLVIKLLKYFVNICKY